MNPLLLHFGLDGIIAPVLYLSAVAAFLLSIFWKPEFGIYVLVPLLPMQTVRYRLHEYPMGHAFIDLMLLAVMLGLLRAREPVLPKIELRGLLLVMAVYTYVMLWNASATLDFPAPLWFDDIRVNNWKNNVVVPVVLFFLVYCAIRKTAQMKILLLLICFTSFLFNRSVYNIVGQRDYETFSYDNRAESGQIGSNGLAALEVQLGFFLIGLWLYEKRRPVKMVYFGLATFCFYLVMFSFSRGAYAAFLVGWLYIGIVRSRWLLIPLTLFLLSWQVVVPAAVRDRVEMTYSGGGELEESAQARVTIWQDAMTVIATDPIFGIGYDTYAYLHRVGSEGGEGGYTDTHNYYVKLLLETGIVGFGLFLILLWKAHRLAYTLYRRAQDPFLSSIGLGLAAWIVCAAVTNVFGDRWNYIQITGFMWAFLAMVVRGHTISKAQAEEASDESVEDGIAVSQLAASV